MSTAFRRWLERKKYAVRTIQSRSAEAARIESYYGNLDTHYDRDRLESILHELEYSKDDQARNRKNPTRIQIDGDIYSNLNTYRSTARLYRKYRDDRS